MLPYFPTSYPDELFFSRCARYREWVGYASFSAVLQDLFGDPDVTLAVDFPRGLDPFVARLPPGSQETPAGVMNEGSVLPFYAPFLPPSRVQQVQDSMRHPHVRVSPAARLGSVMHTAFRPRFLRFCFDCVTADRAHHGETFWHRVHQIPGVELCPTHAIGLSTSAVPLHVRHSPLTCISAEQASRTAVPSSNPPPEGERLHLLRLAQDAAWLLQHPELDPDPEAIRRRSIWLLADRGFATYAGRVREGKLLQALCQYYPSSLLDRLQCRVGLPQQSSPLLRMLRSHPHAQHPIHHLLMIQFLGHSASTFWQVPADPSVFGSGPWPCLNPGATHFRQPVVAVCRITISKREGCPVGTFRCVCGFTYRRNGPDWGPLAAYTARSIVQVGSIWNRALRTLWRDPRLTCAMVGDRLGVSPQTVRRHAVRLRLPIPKPSTRPRQSTAVQLPPQRQPKTRLCTRTRREARQVWLAIVKRCRQTGGLPAKHQAPQLYRWLYEHDRAWLLDHRPSYRPRLARRPPIAWAKRDEIVAAAVREAVQRLSALPGRPLRLSRTTILREARLLTALPTRLEQMPQTIALLRATCETWTQWARRRIAWAVDAFAREHRVPTRRQLVLRVGLGFGLYQIPDMVHALSEAQERLARFQDPSRVPLDREGSSSPSRSSGKKKTASTP